ncbi:Proprotein convertase subtilisin/kexin type 7 [Bulinus truncatus]|nr:Proprotein convertase subtilisin/kexin type 7 [Bulinus truncatus]
MVGLLCQHSITSIKKKLKLSDNDQNSYKMSQEPLRSLIIIFYATAAVTLSFPLRQVGKTKDIARPMIENRDSVLCWTVQINTLKSCTCHQAQFDWQFADIVEKNESHECCVGNSLVLQHLLALTEELDLEIHHTFGVFHDHFLLCLKSLSVIQHPKNLHMKTKSEHLMKLHSEHSRLKVTDSTLFQKYKFEVEKRLNEHEEILWFSSEYIHWRQSRTVLKHGTHDRQVDLHLPDTLLGENDSVVSTQNSSQKPSFNLTHYFNSFINKYSKIKLSSHLTVATPSDQTVSPDHASVSTRLVKLPYKRSVNLYFNDPAYSKQWHLKNNVQKDMDINVTGLWMLNVTGTGVTVAVVDDGVEWSNPDLKNNYNYKGSWDLNSDDPDPSPSSSKTSNHHGTRCAGEIAAVANNNVCGVGVAYGAQFSGLRVLDGAMTDSLEAEAFNKKMDINDIYSCSWGPDDDGRTVDGPHLMAAKAMKYGVDFGRQGFGNIFVVASGNGGEHMDNCNFDGYANSIYTVTIGAVDENGGMPYYAEECASMLGVTFSSGTFSKRDIVTTDWTVGKASGCTDSHTGTSAAAPLAAGMIALMLQARYCLSWRDVQYIIILTSEKVDVDLAHWQINGAGLSHSHKHGFGLLNSWRLVNAARVWETVPWLTSYSHTDSGLSLTISKGSTTPLIITYTITNDDIRGLGLFILESVQLTVWLNHPFRGMLGIKLISPANTVSVLAAPRPLDNSTAGFTDWTFTTVRCWGEQPQGNWTILFIDNDKSTYGYGTVTKLRLTLFGTPMTANEFAKRRHKVEDAMSGEFLQNNFSLPCSPPQKFETSYVPVSDKVLKFIILCGAFCFLMAVYESFEYLLCYNEEKKEAARNRRLNQRAQQLMEMTLCSNNDASNNSSGASNGARMLESSNIPRLTDEEEENEDISDMTETACLLRTSHRDNTSSPESIPLSTFNFQRQNEVNGLLLTEQQLP